MDSRIKSIVIIAMIAVAFCVVAATAVTLLRSNDVEHTPVALTLTSSNTTPEIDEVVTLTATLNTATEGVNVEFFINDASIGTSTTSVTGAATYSYTVSSLSAFTAHAIATIEP